MTIVVTLAFGQFSHQPFTFVSCLPVEEGAAGGVRGGGAREDRIPGGATGPGGGTTKGGRSTQG